MEKRERITLAVFQAVEEINQQVLEAQRLEKTLDTVLFGREGKLDSMALVNLILAVEEKIDDEFGAHIGLVDEQAFASEESSLRSIRTLIDYIDQLLKGQGID